MQISTTSDQKEKVNEIIQKKQTTISGLSRESGVHRTSISQLINHNVQLTEENFNKILKTMKEEQKIEQRQEQPVEIKVEPINEEVVKEKIPLLEWNRHRNLTCHNKDYRMKVSYKFLRLARPYCPICGSAMLLKEEIKKTKAGENVDKIIEQSNLTEILK